MPNVRRPNKQGPSRDQMSYDEHLQKSVSRGQLPKEMLNYKGSTNRISFSKFDVLHNN